MCQMRRGESRLKTTYEGIAVNKITSKYLKIGSTVIEAVEPFQFMYGFCYRITERRCDGSYLLLKGKVKATADLSLLFLGYNLKRVIKILGVNEILARI